MPNIEETFVAGAELAKRNVELNAIQEGLIDAKLSAQLKAIKQAKEGTWFNRGFYIMLSVVGLCLLQVLLNRRFKSV